MRKSSNRWVMWLPVSLAMAMPTHATSREAVQSTEYFEFFSDFSMNLHDALLATGRDRNAGRSELFAHGEQSRCFEELTDEERMGWHLAVDYYASSVSPGSHDDRRQMLPRLVLFYGESDWVKETEQGIAAVTIAMRGAAAPAYNACYWSEQDARNRKWVKGVAERLYKYEESVGERLQRTYQTSWPAPPIPVDIVATVSWAGANTIALIPPPGHIMVSSVNELNQELASLEIVFHEASHLLALDGSPLQDALRANERSNGEIDWSLWHASLFYLTGEVVRSAYARESDNAYLPYAHKNKLYSPELLQALGTAWDPYLDGESTLVEAVDSLLQQTSEFTDKRGF